MRISDWSSDVCSSDLRDFAGKSDETFLSAVGECFFKLQNTAILFSQYPSKTGGILHAHATVAPVPLRAFEKVLGRRRSEERRVGKEGVSTCRSRWSPYH